MDWSNEMPLYEYECQKCKKSFEVNQRLSEKPLDKCEDGGCGGELKKVIGATSFELKGSGWHATDYKSK